VPKASWSEQDIIEYEAMMEEVCTSRTSSEGRIALFLSKLRDAVQAHRPWAVEKEDILRRGAGAVVSTYAKGREQPAMFSYEGEMLTKPVVIGIRRADTQNGRPRPEQALIELATWEEIEVKRQDYLSQRRAYTANVAMMDRILALRDLSPGALTPLEACTSLGVSLHDYLAESGLAA
jgi:hypothetical protein